MLKNISSCMYHVPCTMLRIPHPPPPLPTQHNRTQCAFTKNCRSGSEPTVNKFFNTIFSPYYFLKIHLHLFSMIKSEKKSQNSRSHSFYYYFCMMIEGSRSGSEAGSGSTPLTNGSGSRRSKYMWIRCIRIRNNDFIQAYFITKF